MKKNLITCLAALAFITAANAQIGGGLLNKAKNKASNAVDKATDGKPNNSSGSGTTSPSNSGSGKSSGSSSSEPKAEPAKDYKMVNNDLKKVIGDEDLFYSAILTQGVQSKLIVPKLVNTTTYMEDQFTPKLVNFHDKDGTIFYCYFAVYEGMAKPLSSSKITSDNWDRYTYQKWNWDKSSYTTDASLRYSPWGSSTPHSSFTGIIKQPDGSIITFVVPKLPNAKDKDYTDYVNYISLGYNPILGNYDFDNTEVEILTRTEDAAKTADLAAAKTMANEQAKKIIAAMDAKSKTEADAKVNATTRAKRGMVNAGYEKTMLTYLQANFKDEFRKPEYWTDATLGGLIITSNDWNIKKNDYGLILNRYISCQVVIKNKGKCYVKSFQFAQDYSGGGAYSTSLYYNGFHSDTELIKCEKAN
jgi:hypothetical protein